MNDKEFIFGSVFVMSNRLQALGDRLDAQITMKQWLLIAIISKCETGALSISEIARSSGTSKQNVKKMALLLETRGFVTLKKDKHDARITRVMLTRKCNRYFQKRAGIEDEFMARLFDGLDKRTIKALRQGLSLLSDNISEMENLYGGAKAK